MLGAIHARQRAVGAVYLLPIGRQSLLRTCSRDLRFIQVFASGPAMMGMPRFANGAFNMNTGPYFRYSSAVSLARLPCQNDRLNGSANRLTAGIGLVISRARDDSWTVLSATAAAIARLTRSILLRTLMRSRNSA